MVLAKPGSIKPYSSFECSVYILKKEEGGRHSPFFVGYKPQFYMRTTDVTGSVSKVSDVKKTVKNHPVHTSSHSYHPKCTFASTLQVVSDKGEETKMVMPGDRVKMVVDLLVPVAIEKQMRFAIREGGRTVGAGVVSEILK